MPKEPTDDELKAVLLTKRAKPKPQAVGRLLSTGLTPLNLALSGRKQGGVPKGTFLLLVGDTSSGKTWLTHTLFAEANINPKFNDYRFYYDPTERGAKFDVAHYFGDSLAERIEPPAGTLANPVYSTTLESFYYHSDDCFSTGPCIYILDSMDPLMAASEDERFDNNKAAHADGDDPEKSYNTDRARANSAGLRRIYGKMAQSESILVVVLQTRTNIGFGSQYKPKTKGGGLALDFYPDLVLWTSVHGKIVRPVKVAGGVSLPRHIGTTIEIECKKNRWTGWEGKSYATFYKRFGLDDLETCVDYLLAEGYWKAKGGAKEGKSAKDTKSVEAPEFDWSGPKEGLIKHIQSTERQAELRDLVATVWAAVEEACTVDRINPYR